MDDAEKEMELKWAQKLVTVGELDEAAGICQSLLASYPLDITTNILTAKIALNRENYAEASRLFAGVLKLDQESIVAGYGLTRSLIQMSPADAETALRAIADISGHGIAQALAAAGHREQAMDMLERAVKFGQERAAAHRVRAELLLKRHEFLAAENDVANALALQPDDPISLILFSNIRLHLGDASGALPMTQHAVMIAKDRRPELICDAFRQLGEIYRALGRGDDEIASCREFATIYPDSVRATVTLVRALWMNRRYEAAGIKLATALDRFSGDLEIRWMHCIYTLLPLYSSAKEQEEARRLYGKRLAALSARIEVAPVEVLVPLERLVESVKPYFLAYHGTVDRELQSKFGRLVCIVMAAAHPEITDLAKCQRRPDKKITVVFVSAHIWTHSIWKLIRSWPKDFDHNRFHLICLHLGSERDALTVNAERDFDEFVQLPNDFEGSLRYLNHLGADVIIYPEIGMSGLTVKLAALRLAPVQAAWFGHPVTTGLPTIDYFLTSDVMEPEGGEDNYTEKLVRLPSLSFPYSTFAPSALPATRADFSLPEEKCIFFCAQTPQKYRPQDDDLFPRIAETCPNSCFVFIEGADIFDMSIFMRRLDSAFERCGLDAGSFVILLPRMIQERYTALNSVVDVFLDSMGWSGCNTTLEALHHAVPIVTCPGDTMRSCHSAAILSHISVEDTIARDNDEYIAIAARLANEPHWREDIRRRLSERKAILADGKGAVGALGDFLATVIHGEG
jgi:predicted O-linked N-acetylglucosamine transferase (SPINDLY family)